MISCPKCNASLPDWAQTCQFCQTSVKNVARPVVAKKKVDMSDVPKWIWGAYYALSVYFIFNGAYSIYNAFAISHMEVMGHEMGFGFSSFVALIAGIINIILGLGLIFQVQLLRIIVNFFLGLQIIFGIIGLVLSLPSILITGFFGFLGLMFQVLNIAAAAFMVFLIGETDRVAPNL